MAQGGRKMKRTVQILAAVLGVAVGVNAAEAQKAAAKDNPAMVKKGGYLVTVAGCSDCHTPMKMTPGGPAPDMEKFLSGHQENVPDTTTALGKTDFALASPDLTTWKLPFGMV